MREATMLWQRTSHHAAVKNMLSLCYSIPQSVIFLTKQCVLDFGG
jgi:hypothetical protein